MMLSSSHSRRVVGTGTSVFCRANQVEEVKISIGEEEEITPYPAANIDEIKQFLAEKWGVEEDIISIGWKEG